MSGPAAGGGEVRRLGVLGTLVLDTIRRPGDAEPVEALGGITYALAAFEAVSPAGWRAVPLMKVGGDAAGAARDLLGALETVASRQGVIRVSAPNNRVELVYDDGGERTERLTGGVPGWEWGELAPLVRSCDALYVNLVAGWELDLACARSLREGFEGPLYCDLHSLFLERTSSGPRRRRVPDDWRGWFGCFDWVQINREELATLAADAGREPLGLVERVADDGPRAVFVTLGAAGAAWVGAGAPPARPRGDVGGGGPGHGRRPPPRRVQGGDPTGCGDVWGMTCFTALLEGADAPSAVERANALAARNAACSGGLGLVGADPPPTERRTGGGGPSRGAERGPGGPR